MLEIMRGVIANMLSSSMSARWLSLSLFLVDIDDIA